VEEELTWAEGLQGLGAEGVQTVKRGEGVGERERSCQEGE